MPEKSNQLVTGILYAAGAFLLWGVVPPYWKLIDHVPALQIPAHRILWTCVLLAALITLRRGWGQVREALANRKTALLLVLTAVLVSINWTVFIWAVVKGHLVESSMGYFINPLISVALGVLLLRERLTFWQGVSVAFALGGVAFMAIQLGALPWISLALAFSFGFYGLFRKIVAVDSVTGTFLETLYLLPLTLLYLGREAAPGPGRLRRPGPADQRPADPGRAGDGAAAGLVRQRGPPHPPVHGRVPAIPDPDNSPGPRGAVVPGELHPHAPGELRPDLGGHPDLHRFHDRAENPRPPGVARLLLRAPAPSYISEILIFARGRRPCVTSA